MNEFPRRITLDEWDRRYSELRAAGMAEPGYGGPIRRHVADGDRRLLSLQFDNSAAALRLWNFLLTEEERLHAARRDGQKLVGAMKDLGTVPVLAYALPKLTAFYPDGAWWQPCVMEFSSGLLEIADSLGVGESFCPVRAMLGAFVSKAHFPIPDLLTCSVGATCDDFSAIAQRLCDLGHSILWWEIPHRRPPDPGEESVMLPGGFVAAAAQVAVVRAGLGRIREALEDLAGQRLSEEAMRDGIRAANRVRRCLREVRRTVYGAAICPIPALEMQIAEMLALHFCSDREESLRVLEALLAEARARVAQNEGIMPASAPRLFWVNPVADLRAMNLLEDCGARVAGSDYLFYHAIDEIPEELPPLEALARMALADPMAGTASDRAARIMREVIEFRAEGLVVSRIPGASHCATEGARIREIVHERLGLPTVEIEVPPVCDAGMASLRNRLEALIEIILARRPSKG
jgi:hypothetical protein